jgi:hypothetical protein
MAISIHAVRVRVTGMSLNERKIAANWRSIEIAKTRTTSMLSSYERRVSPFKNRFNSDWRTLHPLPALMAFIMPSRMYLRNVGFEILRYSIASSVVKTVSLSVNDIEFLPFALIFSDLFSKYRAYHRTEALFYSTI